MKRLSPWIIAAALMVAVGLGCRPSKHTRERQLKLESDRARHTLENRIKDNRDPDGRVKTALAKLTDSVRDDVPFLIFVNLGCTDAGEPMLFFTCLDEGRNLRGIHVREEYTDPSSRTTVLEERYPLYVAWPETEVLAIHMFHVELRDTGQRKDEDAWQDYTILALEDLVRKFIYNGPVDEVIKVPPPEAVDREIPLIRVSLPEVNLVRVLISIYDREGHESEAIEVGISPAVYRRLKGRGQER